MWESRKTEAGAQENRSWRLDKTGVKGWEKQRQEINQEWEIRKTGGVGWEKQKQEIKQESEVLKKQTWEVRRSEGLEGGMVIK